MSEQEIQKAVGQEVAGFEGAATTEISLRLDDDLTVERAGEIGDLIGKLGRATSWWTGDFVRECRRLFGYEMGLEVAVEHTGYADRTLNAWAETAELIPVEERSKVLSFTTHIEMRKLCQVNVEKFRELRSQLEMYRHREGRSRNHKDIRGMVEKLLTDSGYQLSIADFPTTEEDLADARAALDVAERELTEAKVRLGELVRCPKCQRVWPEEDATTPPDYEAPVPEPAAA